jgi:peptidoglycan/xylan/chitin deacetylase (PgdA/CDA1 family)
MRLALTFDDGPGPATAKLLDVLRAKGARATFFLLGQNIERARDVVVRLTRDGHVLGNHSWSHPKADGISETSFVEEIRRTDALLDEIRRAAGFAGERGPFPVRLPYGPGLADPRLRALASIGRTHVHWTGDFQDWVQPPPSPQALVDAFRAHATAQNAAGLDTVLDLHDSSRRFEDRSATVEAVRLLLETPGLEIFAVPAGS